MAERTRRKLLDSAWRMTPLHSIRRRLHLHMYGTLIRAWVQLLISRGASTSQRRVA